jgi:hypothetical protein
LEYIPFIIAGLFLLVRIIRAKRQRRLVAQQQAQQASAPPVTPAPQPLVPPEIIGPRDPVPLAAQLHQIENSFAPFAASSAHPSDLRQHPDFRHGVALLADSSIPLETVLQYALGGNWMLACVAITALAERKDATSAADQVLAHFDRMAVWCMYYALEFFLVVDPRPATGAPAVLAKDGWRENPILPLIFRDYFSRRAALGDVATFGNALQSSFASSPALIRAFLERVNHPFATNLIGQVDEWQRTSVDRAFLATFGRFWSDGRDNETLVEPDVWQQPLTAAHSTLQQTMPRSLLISGEPLVGKTSLLRLLARRLRTRAGRSSNRAAPISWRDRSGLASSKGGFARQPRRSQSRRS